MPGSGSLFAWPTEFTILPGSSVKWPFFLHPQHAGQLSLQGVWQYEAQPAATNMPWRMLRWSHTMDVQPLLHIAPSITPSATDLHKSLLYLQATVPEVSVNVLSSPQRGGSVIADELECHFALRGAASSILCREHDLSSCSR